MRKPMMAGNWKMNKSIDEAVALATTIRDAVATVDSVDRVLCPTYLCLPAVKQVLDGSSLALGAQNMHWADSGAYTGEISAPMLSGVVDYVIIGHSERRQFFAESDESVNQKTHAALAHGLIPIVCVGESLDVRQAEQTAAYVDSQVRGALVGLSGEQVAGLIVAYEPIWAIGTGLAATPEQAEEVCGGVVRHAIADLFGADVAAKTRVLYGGSTKDSNIDSIMRQPNIDGALIGGAALQPENYCNMVRITAELYG